MRKASGASITHDGDDVRLGLGLWLRPAAPRQAVEGEASPPQGRGGREAAGAERQHYDEADRREDEEQKQAAGWYLAAQARRPKRRRGLSRLYLLRHIVWEQVAERAVGKRVLEHKGRAAQRALWLAPQTALQALPAEVVLAAGGDEGVEQQTEADGAGERVLQFVRRRHHQLRGARFLRLRRWRPLVRRRQLVRRWSLVRGEVRAHGGEPTKYVVVVTRYTAPKL